MQLNGLLSLMRQSPLYRSLLVGLRAGQEPPDQHILRAARPFVIAALAQDLGRPALVVTAQVDRAYNVAEQLPVWLPEASILRFVEPSSLFYERSPWASTTIRARLDVLAALCPPAGTNAASAPRPPIVVTSALALMQRTLPAREFRAASRILKVGQQADPDKLLRAWLGIGYTPVSIVTEAGTFSRRGGIVDVFPINAARPTRLEFFGDEIDSLRAFDPTTQRSAEKLNQLLMVPAREALPRLGGEVSRQLADWFEALPLAEDDLTSPRPDQADLAAETAFPSLEFYLPLFYEQASSLVDYLPDDALIIVEDWAALSDCIADLETQAIGQREEKARAGLLPPSYPLPYFTWDELRENLAERRPLHLGGTGLPAEETEPSELPALGSLFAAGARHGGQLRALLESLRDLVLQDERPIVISYQAQRLAELWREQDRSAGAPVSNIAALPDGITFVEGALAEGWSFQPDEGTRADGSRATHLFTDAEIFGWKRPEPRRHPVQRAVSPEAYFADIVPGDYVVHVEYGIGRFAGLQKRQIDDQEREYLAIQYAGSDMLYVPVDQADRLSRYVGVEGQEPALSKLGSPEWVRTREAARTAAEEAARELLDLYARRASVQGYTFSPDSPWQAELEASFPYIETEDQLSVLQAVKVDMERPVPMDRLICGDVGYGKTEVALRAAFKAVMDGKQVAVLVPTTVLAQQHYNTFGQRMAAFPVQVEMLSRFRTPKEQKDITDRTGRGEVDILIGTHRILQADVTFRDLGLLIIDEEQRFGVTHKERLKRMRTEVDVLTMTATPIPRTLYMSLSGIRDISMIETPPEERLPVLTHVGPYDEKLVRQAILRELDRGGQVFFVHNRVSTIATIAEHLGRLVPEASLVIGHGQMHEDDLEQVMAEFAGGAYDMLLCTTIIESGLDIPNANTIIIDRADTFGLAQLHQLRGRVGRGANRAYAYLFHHSGPLTADARARLETIAEQTELGAGYSIAMRDLEIRGAGDLLGMRQSGYIASVGFHLYTQLLAQSVQRLKTEQPTPAGSQPPEPGLQLSMLAPAITVDLQLPAHIPVEYIPEMAVRLQLYRRLADLHSLDSVAELDSELTDRFGPLPLEVRNLLFQVRVKLLAGAANVTAIKTQEEQIVVRLPYLAGVDRMGLQTYLGNGARVARTGVWLRREPDSDDWQERLLTVLNRLRLNAPEGVPQ